jgi:hypothetical protein
VRKFVVWVYTSADLSILTAMLLRTSDSGLKYPPFTLSAQINLGRASHGAHQVPHLHRLKRHLQRNGPTHIHL